MRASRGVLVLLVVAINGGHCSSSSAKPKEVEAFESSTNGKSFNYAASSGTEKRADKKELESLQTEENGAEQEKKSRTILGPVSLDHRGPTCCDGGYGYGHDFQSRPKNAKPSSYGGSHSLESEKYPSRYSSRPDDRYGWQSSIYPLGSGRPGNAFGSHDSGQSGDRYASRPQYGGNGYPPWTPGPARPTSGGPGGHGDGGGYGGGGYEAGGRPGGFSGYDSAYGGNRPGQGTHGYGISGSFADGDDFDENGEPSFPEPGGPPNNVGNIHTQKAIALKALAGVALIGAAAALAANPVLLPLSVVSGRRRRSTNEIGDLDVQYSGDLLDDQVAKINSGFLTSPACVAKMACQIQRDYILNLKRKENNTIPDQNLYHSLVQQFMTTIQIGILEADYASESLKRLFKLALTIGSKEGNCNVLVCTFAQS